MRARYEENETIINNLLTVCENLNFLHKSFELYNRALKILNMVEIPESVGIDTTKPAYINLANDIDRLVKHHEDFYRLWAEMYNARDEMPHKDLRWQFFDYNLDYKHPARILRREVDAFLGTDDWH